MPLVYIDGLGFHRARLADIKASLEASYRGIHGVAIDVDLESTDAQELGIYAERYDDFFQKMEAVYNGRSRAGATGAGLARLVRLNGVTKHEPAHSTTTATLGGVPGTFIPAGARIANEDDPTAIFTTNDDATLDGLGAAEVDVTATVSGAVPGAAGKLTVTLTVISGWATATNAAGVSLGDVGETDPRLRARDSASVALPSQGLVDGLRAALLQLDNVTQCIVRENPEDTVQILDDGGPLEPHAIQVIILGGDSDEIAETIWTYKSAGCTMVGATTETFTDSQGTDHLIKWDVPVDVPIYVVVNTASALSTDEKTAIAEAIAARGIGSLTVNGVTLPASQIGEDVAVSDVYAAITALSVTTLPGLKVGEIDIGTTPAPATDDDVVIAYNERATWSSGNVTFVP